MSLTLGEKLQQAREERGITISEVAEQTRISPLYLECIENNDYRTLPGGIFNKGFIKSYAKYVGVDEQEALADYAAILSSDGGQSADELKTYRPQVLTDDHVNASRLPTVIFAVVILGLMTWGALTFVNYYTRQNQEQPATSEANANSPNANSTPETNAPNANETPAQTASLGETKIEFKPVKNAIWLSSNKDGVKASSLITAEKPAFFEPKENLKLSYAREQAQNAQLTINGKAIKLPALSDVQKGRIIEFEITKDNFNQIWQSGAVTISNQAAPRAAQNNAPR